MGLNSVCIETSYVVISPYLCTKEAFFWPGQVPDNWAYSICFPNECISSAIEAAEVFQIPTVALAGTANEAPT
jgi:hypothetical protein